MRSNFDTSDRNAQKGGDFVPRLAMINDIAGFGRCSTTVSLPVISVMKVQVCPVPTSVLSNHLGFPLCHFDDYTSHDRIQQKQGRLEHFHEFPYNVDLLFIS